MILSTPHLIYILGAYGLTFILLGLFLGLTLYQWKQTVRSLEKVSRET